MSEKRLPPHVLQILTIAQLNLELAKMSYQKTIAEVERDFEFRFAESEIGKDGTIHPIARNAAPPDPATRPVANQG